MGQQENKTQDTIKTFYQEERQLLLKHVNLDKVLTANGFFKSGVMSKDPDYIGQKYSNGKGLKVKIFRGSKTGILFALDYRDQNNKKSFSAWELMVGMHKSRTLQPGVDPLQHEVLKMNTLRRWLKVSERSNHPEILEFYQRKENEVRIVEAFEKEMALNFNQDFQKPSPGKQNTNNNLEEGLGGGVKA